MKTIAMFSSKELNQLFGSNINFNETLSINTDSRDLDNEIFLPLVGEKYDGHDFIVKVINKLSCFSFCEKNKVNKVSKVSKEHKDKLIIVENTLHAYHTLANFYRNKINPKVIAITGSSGKTTIKDIVYSIFSEKYISHKTMQNYNNEFGLPKTILEMPENTEVLVLEMGMRGLGEIRFLSKTAKPDIAIISNIGSAHIGRLGSVENILTAKSEILEYLNPNGLAILPKNNNLINKAKEISNAKIETFDITDISNIKFNEDKTEFIFNGENYLINAIGSVFALSSIPAIISAISCDIKTESIKTGLKKFIVPKGRGDVTLIDKKIIIDESYNANPESVKSALDTLLNCFPNSYKKIFVLGELAELGEFEESELGEVAKQIQNSHVNNVILVGNVNKIVKDILRDKAIFATNIEDCCRILNEKEEEVNENTVITIKGSRVAGLDKVVKYLKKEI